MDSSTPCEALRRGVCLRIRYDGYVRDVEVHAVGWGSEGQLLMRVWQIQGGSVSNEPIGWKLLRLDETVGFALLTERSGAPRVGYKSGDKAIQTIICQL
jgi:hypothetical protein